MLMPLCRKFLFDEKEENKFEWHLISILFIWMENLALIKVLILIKIGNEITLFHILQSKSFQKLLLKHSFDNVIIHIFR